MRMSPVSKTSSSGFVPASRIRLAMRASCCGQLIMMNSDCIMVLKSRLQTSGLSSITCCTRRSAVVSVVPGAATLRSSGLGT